jgi:hypothetical protein
MTSDRSAPISRSSRGLVFFGMVLTALGVGLVLGFALILFLGPEAFANV